MSEVKTDITFLDHLNELKFVIIKIAISWIGFTGIAFIFRNQLVDLITKPARDMNLTLHFLSPTDSFFFVINICSLAGLLVSLPFLSVFIWHYISPALIHKEKAFIASYIFAIFLLSFIAILFGFYFLIPSTLHFLLNFTPTNTQLILTASEYTSFLTSLLGIMILVFQTPVLVYGLIRSDLLPSSFFISKRKEIYFVILIFMAAFGSPDVFTWAVSCVPVLLLYELAILLASRNKTIIKQNN
ncbi:MAG: twin-arginine translocase subunit TatC [candidate division SR1 bacterium]|nr:twin-arginine translocase subunit TatC [candidate division SR1 bacterium]